MKLWGRVLIVAIAAALGAIVLPAAAEPPPPTVTVTSARTTYTAGSTATFQVSVTDGNNGTLTVSAVISGKSYDLQCGGVGVNSDTFDCSVGLIYNTRIEATIGGVTGKKTFLVRPSMATYPRGTAEYSGHTAIYVKGAEPLFSSAVYPKRSMCIKHEVQVHRAAGWKTVLLGGCKYPGSNGRVAWRWYGSHPTGYDFRVRAVFPGDALNVGGPGAPAYFRFRSS